MCLCVKKNMLNYVLKDTPQYSTHFYLISKII